MQTPQFVPDIVLKNSTDPVKGHLTLTIGLQTLFAGICQSMIERAAPANPVVGAKGTFEDGYVLMVVTCTG